MVDCCGPDTKSMGPTTARKGKIAENIYFLLQVNALQGPRLFHTPIGVFKLISKFVYGDIL